MTDHGKGWLIFIAALGMLAGLLGHELGKLTSWAELFAPQFVSVFLIHIGAVITAFIGGRKIPTKDE